MDKIGNDEIKDIVKKYEKRISKQIPGFDADVKSNEAFSREYELFRKEALGKKITRYEKYAKLASSIIGVKPKESDLPILEESIKVTHLNITPRDAASFATVVALMVMVMGVFLGVFTYFMDGFSLGTLFFIMLLMLISFVLIGPLTKLPVYYATRYRLKASNQMVLCILYIVMYMRHTSNLEHAIKFAAEHIGDPLALDLRRVFWNVETGNYETIKESLDDYLIHWKKYNIEFVESINLIESSLAEPSEQKRVERLEKALQVMLEGTYTNMMHFAHNLKSPVTMLHMLGIILPILGLIILPLMGSFLGVKWWQLAIFYNIFLPLTVYFVGMNMLIKRPTGYGQTNIFEDNPMYEDYKYLKVGKVLIKPIIPAVIIGFLICLLGLSPLIIHSLNPEMDFTLGNLGKFFDYRPDPDDETILYGPFGIGAALLSLLIPLGIAFGIGTYYKIKTSRLIKIREETILLEREFTGSLFQLGNRIGDGLPSEIAFSKVAENMQGTTSGNFFTLVSNNIRRAGMSIHEAIFDREHGAILFYPSSLIESSMNVLVQSSKKGPIIVSKALISISDYVDRINNINERLKDLLADITSSMKSQIKFLTPVIAGVVVGIGCMITMIIGNLGTQMSNVVGDESGSMTSVGSIGELFPIDKVMPPYFFQIVVGLYVVEIVIILTILSTAIEDGLDKLTQDYNLGKNLYTSLTFYFIIALVVTIIFGLLAGVIAQPGQFSM